jgi:hypothetical protein
MNSDKKLQRKPISYFRTFLIGVTLGAVFGLVTAPIWGGLPPYRTGISAGFWGLIGGASGLIIGVVYRLMIDADDYEN